MDDLTSKKAVCEGLIKYGFLAPDMTVHEFVEDELPSVPAVPLDELCEWLSKNSIIIPCASCANFGNEYCTAVGDKSRPCPKNTDSWRRVITEWMEEQDAAD